MRVLTADQSFGVIISAAEGALDPRFFVFQLIIGGQVVGDSDASIIGSAMSQLSNLPVLDHPKLSETRPDPASALELIGSDDACNPAMFNGSESLDAWSVAGFHRASGDTVWIAQRYGHERRQRSGAGVVAVVGRSEYDRVVEHVRGLWADKSR